MKPEELVAKVLACSSGQIAIEELEDWIDAASWDVHQSGNQALVDAVFEIEAIFSDYFGEAESESSIRNRLGNTIAELGSANKPSCLSKLVRKSWIGKTQEIKILATQSLPVRFQVLTAQGSEPKPYGIEAVAIQQYADWQKVDAGLLSSLNYAAERVDFRH